ncbi:MAG: MFS transporter [Bacteroidia bacterium]|nr:MFS transporter [Bacteroidia bacterium]MCZ2249897.1 MFS transporter [Bacteroidia bacterium]
MHQEPKLWNKNFINACVANFLVACAFFLLMPTIPVYLSEHLGVPHSKIGIVLSSYAIALLLIRPFSGYMVDIFPRKKLYLLGLALFIATFVGYYFAVSVLFFIVLRFIHGLFWGISTVSANTVAIDIIPASRRAEGIGYFGATMNIAMALAPFVAVNIYDNYGFNFLISAGLTMGILAVGAVGFIKVPQRSVSASTPALSFDRFILIKALPIFFNQLFLAFGWGTLVAFAVLYGKEIGIENPGYFFLFMASGIVLSRINSGKLVDKGFLHNVMAIAITAIGVGFLLFAYFHNIYLFCISAFILGLGYGTLFPALQTIYINMAPSSKRGTANSTYLTGFDLGIGIGMLLGAYIGDKYNFSIMYMITSALCVIALILYWFNSRKVFDKNKLH